MPAEHSRYRPEIGYVEPRRDPHIDIVNARRAMVREGLSSRIIGRGQPQQQSLIGVTEGGRLYHAYDVPCRDCRANPGEPCRVMQSSTRKTGHSKIAHQARVTMDDSDLLKQHDEGNHRFCGSRHIEFPNTEPCFKVPFSRQ